MILGIIKSIAYMFIFYVFFRISSFLLKFIYSIFYKDIKNKNNLKSNSKTLKMLQCEQCKIYITSSDSYKINGKIFCKEHKD